MEGIDKVMGNTGVEGQWFFMIQEKQGNKEFANGPTELNTMTAVSVSRQQCFCMQQSNQTLM